MIALIFVSGWFSGWVVTAVLVLKILVIVVLGLMAYKALTTGLKQFKTRKSDGGHRD